MTTQHSFTPHVSVTASFNIAKLSFAGVAGLFALAILGVFASVALAFAQFETTQTAQATKGNRVEASLPAACDGQSWGNWSAACLATLNGERTVRSISTTTVEQRPGGPVSVLVRTPIEG
ncbi:Uncharacterised protein [Pannonibacter phragmitetus]|uniref:Uncharacterized protein n=1 Tax=Pannonibacter phragmitetus TaxID=121719 RepID=A0A378ZWD6_9HYPH|nr:hypothetical protein [Pannonibacter phragmitetus]SUB01169.1 Uncharacterised protein [Pannonibacter phragmitetus]